ncbi:MAG TPA: hypothetical protein VMV31_02030 [Terriglobales bacterium]|nr:hypothetical protein [Terriglobales bacterium]
MSASRFTHLLKFIGFGYRMWLGVAVLLVLSGVACFFFGKRSERQRFRLRYGL